MQTSDNKKMALHWKIAISIVMAVFAGLVTNVEDSIYGVTFYGMYEFVGSLFINALKMIIVPLVTASIITGVSNIGDGKSLGKIGLKTVSFYLMTSITAICIGLLVVNIIQPGIVNGAPGGDLFGLGQLDNSQIGKIGEQGLKDIMAIFHRMIPSNIVAAAAQGNMLGLIFFSLLFGIFMSKIKPEYKETMSNFWQGIFDTMMLFTIWIMKYIAPVGIFGLIAKTITETGFSAFQPLFIFFMTVLLALSIHVFIMLPLALKFIGKVSPIRHFKAMMPALLTAFSTSSSSATLPMTIECVEKHANVSPRVASFVLPLGSTVNMDGTALYECVAAIFLAQMYGLDLSYVQQFTVLLLALLTSIGVAGVPAASLIALVIVINAIGLPSEAIGIIMVTDRITDMFRTSVNIFSDSCGAVIIASTEGETNLLPDRDFL